MLHSAWTVDQRPLQRPAAAQDLDAREPLLASDGSPRSAASTWGE